MTGVRYDFGEQWNEYSDRITDTDLEASYAAFKSLLPSGYDANGKSLLDIGCGTGIHAISAHKAGFSPVVAVDYYEGSVIAARKMASRTGALVEVKQDDILNPQLRGEFDVVYSWGVLHHTGNMKLAIENAARFVKPGGVFIISIYLKTPLCGFWKIEKRIYTLMPRFIQSVFDYGFRGLMYFLKAVDHRQEKERGMDWRVGVRDWLGGYPYESASAIQVKELVGGDFRLLDQRNTVPGPGILGTICAEYVFERAS